MANDTHSGKIELSVMSFLLDNANRANQFAIIINRVEPRFDMIKSLAVSKLVQSVSFIADGMQYEEVQLGSAYMNVAQELQSGEISVTFTEGQNKEVFELLTQHEGKNILPSDGTYLLPYEYYFSIDIVHHFNTVDNMLLNVLTSGDFNPIEVIASGNFVLDGNLEYGYEAGDEQLQMIQAKFKPMMSF